MNDLLDQDWLDAFNADPQRCTCRIAVSGPIRLVLDADSCTVHAGSPQPPPSKA